MPIDKSSGWGTEGICSEEPRICADDSSVSAAVLGDAAAITLTGGNLWSALGSPAPALAGGRVLRLPMDALIVDERSRLIVDSFVVRRRWLRGGPLRGSVTWISNSGMHRGRSVLPRAHPNDGQWDRLVVGPSMSVKARLMAWHRARRGDHLPHPDLAADRVGVLAVQVRRGDVVILDGVRSAPSRSSETLRLRVVADRWTATVASPTV